MEQDMYIDKQLKAVDKAPTTPEEKDVIANKFIDDAYQCGCGPAFSGEKDAWGGKGAWTDKELFGDKDSYIIQKKILAEKQAMNDKDVFWTDKDSSVVNKKLAADDKFCGVDKETYSKDKFAAGDKDTFYKDKLGMGEKDTFSKDKFVAGDKDIVSKQQPYMGEKPSVCDKDEVFDGKVTPEEYAKFQQELQKQEQLGQKISQALRAGTFGDRDTREAIADNFRILAQNGGQAGERQLLDKINAGLAADGSQYHLRFGQNIIKTPGGRHLEIVNRSGRVTDTMDFVVPVHSGGKDAGIIQKQTNVNKELDSDTTGIRKQINPAKENLSW